MPPLLSRRTTVSVLAVAVVAVGASFILAPPAPTMSSLAAVKARNAAVNLAGRTAVVVGGTSGIGRGVAVRLAAANASVMIVGRDEVRAAEVLADLARANGSGTHSFVRCDGSSIAATKDFSSAFLKDHKTLDLLVLTQGIATMQGRTPTPEGLDQKLAVHYFGRMALVAGLLPAMRASAAADPAYTPRVLTVLSAGVHGVYAHHADDFELVNNYGLKNAADAAGLYNDVAMDSLARENPSIAFIHAAPGFVATNWGKEMPTVVQWLLAGLRPLGRSLYDCGEFMSEPLLRPLERGKGPHFILVGQDADPAKPTGVHEQIREGVWGKTKEVLGRFGVAI
jgi:NAD(P)-dependent dehydrogenase (short-subunit alcohol dehydrogenase family)